MGRVAKSRVCVEIPTELKAWAILHHVGFSDTLTRSLLAMKEIYESMTCESIIREKNPIPGEP